jgi:hypothetical protein
MMNTLPWAATRISAESHGGGAAMNPSVQPPQINQAWVAQQWAIYHASSVLPFRERTTSSLMAKIAA